MSTSIPMTNLTHSNGNFLAEADALGQSIENVKANIQEIKNIQSKILGSTSVQQEGDLSNERDSVAANTKSMLVQAKDEIKKIERETARLPRDHPELQLRQNQQQRLHDKFTSCLQEYQNVEEAYMQAQRDRIKRQYFIVNPNATEQDINSYLNDSSNKPVFQQALLHSERARAAAAEVQKRHNDIKQIEQSIAELAELTQQMALAVNTQDEAIVEISGHIEETKKDQEQGVEDIFRAQRLALSARKKKWITFLILLIVIAIVIAILVVYVGNKKK